MFSLNASNGSASGRECFIDDSVAVKTVRIIAYSVIIFVSVIGNSGIIAILWKEKRMRHSINYFIANMSTCDFLMTVGYMPRMLTIITLGYEWRVGGTPGLMFCKTVSFLYDTCVCVSIFTAIAISLDRFLAVAFPLRSFITNRTSKLVIAAIWLLAVVIQSPLLHAAQTATIDGKRRCHSNLDQTFKVGSGKLYYISVSSIYASSLCVTVVLYSLIVISLKLKRDRLLGSHSSYACGQNRREKSCSNVVHMVLAVIGFFVFSWALFVLQLVLYSHDIVLSKSCNVNFIVGLLAHSNCAVTPCLYVTLSENYRKGFRKLVWCCGVRDETETSTAAVRNLNSVEFSVRTRRVQLNTSVVETGRSPLVRSAAVRCPQSPSPPTATGTLPLQWTRDQEQETLL